MKELDRRIFSREGSAEDQAAERTLRPQTFSEFPGQEQLKHNLSVYIEAARNRNEALITSPLGTSGPRQDHARADHRARDGRGVHGHLRPALEKPRDLAGVLTKLDEHAVLFIDEIHRLGVVVEEYLYSAMEDFFLDIVIDQGPPRGRSSSISSVSH